MSEAVVCALIGAAASLAAAVMSVRAAEARFRRELETHSAVQDERIANLTEEVRKHNQLVERTYRLESEVRLLSAGMLRQERTS